MTPRLIFSRVEPTQLAFIILGASMAALALMILFVAILATGATRHEVYRSSVGRAGGRVGESKSLCFHHIWNQRNNNYEHEKETENYL